MARRIDETTPAGRRTLIVVGLTFIAMMVFPFACHESGGCRLGVVTPWSAFGWAAKAAIALFVTAGLALIARGLRLGLLADLFGISLIVLFAVLANAILFGLRAPACGPLIGAMRALAEVEPYRDCALWPTLAAVWIDAFFLGFILETVRSHHLPDAWRPALKPWTQGLLLVSLAPLLLCMLLLLLPSVGGEVLKERWERWRGG